MRLEALWRSASLDLERTNIRSPVDGIIVGRNITEGQTLATGLEAKTLFIIAGDLDSMEINARIDESDIANIKHGQPATFTVDAFPGRRSNATVKQIRMAPQVVSNVVTYTVVLKTTNPDGILLPGMTVMANIVTRRTPAAMTVPMAALRYRSGPWWSPPAKMPSSSSSDSIWVLRDGKPSCFRSSRATKTAITSSSIRALRSTDLVILRENKECCHTRAGDS